MSQIEEDRLQASGGRHKPQGRAVSQIELRSQKPEAYFRPFSPSLYMYLIEGL